MNSEPVENSECVQMASGSMSKRHSECSEEEPVRKIPKMTGEEAALYNSSWYEREEIAKMISAEDASSDFQDDEALETASQTKLHAAVSSENPSAVHAVLQSDPNIIDVTDSHGQTALHYAARNGHEEIVKMLLVKGASTHLQDKKGQTLLHIIANAPTLVNFNNGFYNEDEDYEDRDLELQEYVDEKYIRVMKAVLQNDPNITDITDSLGKTALHYAARNGYEEIVKILLVKGAIPHLQDKRGMTPLHSIVSNTSWGTGLYEDEVFQEYLDERYIRVMKEIVAAGANVLLQDKCGQTPFIFLYVMKIS
ncbi:serine/threonine-protein phosphatase 6 regulatory ankyrin repeat subunit B-like isoform X2 [Uloborus diversus]|uniref:serine/threonine-protein phosphatase 6 regulatory ankyrin repeat subunit B-like isoform X2 n=1 Tax=Uloborus diversus TaxID=327109 RepID=UPI00240985A7|nr:serine/threonine-protein phosphatase 6 regulatory ankyrin repeat subunit B-like isoform X2 [Uloborus diversus]